MPRREGLFPARVSVSLPVDTMQRLKRAAARYDVAPGVLARWALEHGFKAAVDKARKEASERASLAASNAAHGDDENGL